MRVPVFPTHILCDRLLFFPMTAESWLQPDVAEDEIFSGTADSLGMGHPTVVTVLGAGNVASIPATDSLTKIFQDSCSVLLKMNPVNDYLGPFFELRVCIFDQGRLPADCVWRSRHGPVLDRT